MLWWPVCSIEHTCIGNFGRGPYEEHLCEIILKFSQWSRNEMRGLSSIYLFFATSLINSIIQEHVC